MQKQQGRIPQIQKRVLSPTFLAKICEFLYRICDKEVLFYCRHIRKAHGELKNEQSGYVDNAVFGFIFYGRYGRELGCDVKITMTYLG